MTVSTTTAFSSQLGDGVLLTHDFAFTYDLVTDITVEKNDIVSGATTTLTLGEDFSISDTTATFFDPLDVDFTYTFTRDTGDITRVEFPPVFLIDTLSFETQMDVNTYIIQEEFQYEQIVNSVGDPDQAITTTEKIAMPSFTGIQVNRSGFYIILVNLQYRPDNNFPRADTDVTVRVRAGKLGDLTSALKATGSFYIDGDQDNTKVTTGSIVFTGVYIAAGQKLCVTVEASITPDGDFTVFNSHSTVGILI